MSSLVDILPNLGHSSYALWITPQGIADNTKKAEEYLLVANKVIPIAIPLFAAMTLVATGVIFHCTVLPFLCTAGLNLLVYKYAIIPRQEQYALEAKYYEHLASFGEEGSRLAVMYQTLSCDQIQECLTHHFLPNPPHPIADNNEKEHLENLSVRVALFNQVLQIQEVAAKQLKEAYAAFKSEPISSQQYKEKRDAVKTAHADYFLATMSVVFSKTNITAFCPFNGTFSDLGLNPAGAVWKNLEALDLKAYLQPREESPDSLLTNSQDLCKRWVADSVEGLVALRSQEPSQEASRSPSRAESQAS